METSLLWKARRVAGPGLLALGLLGMAQGAARQDVPLEVSRRAAARFWRGNEVERRLNGKLFRDDRELGLEVIQRDRDWPLDRNAVLVLEPPRPGVPQHVIQQRHRNVAYVLAPRHVQLVLGPTSGRGFVLKAAEATETTSKPQARFPVADPRGAASRLRRLRPRRRRGAAVGGAAGGPRKAAPYSNDMGGRDGELDAGMALLHRPPTPVQFVHKVRHVPRAPGEAGE